MPTTEEYLQRGFDKFEEGLGSTPYDSNVESGWKNLFRWKVSQNLSWIPGHETFLDSMCVWMGEYAAAQPSLDGHVHLAQVNASFAAVQEYAFHANGDIATNLC